VLVPQLGLQEQQGSKVALVVEEGDKVALRPVTVADRIGDFYVVKSGLKPGDRVIVEGTQKARPGMQVKPVPQKATGKPEGSGG
jgi:membrane fusion protein (multidrug efflux system)